MKSTPKKIKNLLFKHQGTSSSSAAAFESSSAEIRKKKIAFCHDSISVECLTDLAILCFGLIFFPRLYQLIIS